MYIGKVQSRGPLGHFTLRFRHVSHNDPELEVEEPWCSKELRKMPLRRFGVLLVEICLGEIACDAGYNASSGTVEIDFDVDVNDPESTYAYDLDGILERVRREAGMDFRDAVDYCLMQETSTENFTHEEIDGFFENIVGP